MKSPLTLASVQGSIFALVGDAKATLEVCFRRLTSVATNAWKNKKTSKTRSPTLSLIRTERLSPTQSSSHLHSPCRPTCPFHTAKNYTLSLAKRVLSGKMDEVIKTIEHNVRLV